ncbi:LysR family transcriptional regulator [Arthrobacter tecti]
MPDLDLRLLGYFVGVVETGSFTKAAAKLHVSQPALSQGIRRLENVVGAPLIERGPRGSMLPLSLTTSGTTLFPAAREILLQADRALKNARESAARVQLRIGFGTSTPRELTRIALRSASKIGHVEAVLEYVPWGEEVSWLSRGEVDLIFIQAAHGFMPQRVEVVPLQSIRRMAVFHADHPLASRAQVSMADLVDEPIIDAASDRDYWLVNPRPNNRAPEVVGPPARNVDEMLAFVSAGRGMAITSSSVAASNGSTDLAFVAISDVEAATVYLATNKSDERPEIAAMVDYTVRELRDASHAPGSEGIPLAHEL